MSVLLCWLHTACAYSRWGRTSPLKSWQKICARLPKRWKNHEYWSFGRIEGSQSNSCLGNFAQGIFLRTKVRDHQPIHVLICIYRRFCFVDLAQIWKISICDYVFWRIKIKSRSEHLSQLQAGWLQDTELYSKFLNVVSLAFLITSTILGIGFLAYSTLFANFICMWFFVFRGA